MRESALERVPLVWHSESSRHQVLRRVRCGAHHVGHTGSARCRACRPRCGTPPRVRPLRGSRGLHDGVGEPRRRRGAGSALALLRDGADDHRSLRRDRREVHRRRCHGRLGNADRPRGRRRAGGACRARSDCSRDVARGRSRRAWSPRASRDPHRRGRGHSGSRGPGNGRRRPRQHRIAHPVRRGARPGARRRSNATRDGGVDRLRGGRRARAQGQGRGGTAVARASRDCGPAGRHAVGRRSKRRSSAAIESCGS